MVLDKKVTIFLAVFIGSVLLAAGIGALSFVIYPNPDKKEQQIVNITIPPTQMVDSNLTETDTQPAAEPVSLPESFSPHTGEIAYIREEFLLKFPNLGLQVIFPPSTTLSNNFSFSVATPEAIKQALTGYREILAYMKELDEQGGLGGTEYPPYSTPGMDINFFNQQKAHFLSQTSFTYTPPKDRFDSDKYVVTFKKFNGRPYLVYDVNPTFGDVIRVYSTFIGNKRLDISLPIYLGGTRYDGWSENLDKVFSQIKLTPFNSHTPDSRTHNKIQLNEKDLQKATLYFGHTVDMVRNEQEGIFRFKINPALPAFTFHVFSFTSSSSGRIEFYNNSSSKPRQIIVLTDPNFLQSQEMTLTFNINDINFDGYLDIGIRVDGGAKWAAFQYWTFDPSVGLFVTSPAAQDFRQISFNHMQFDIKNKRIITNNFEGTLLAYKYVYALEGTHLRLVEQYHQEQVYEEERLIEQCKVTTGKYEEFGLESSVEVLNENCLGYSL